MNFVSNFKKIIKNQIKKNKICLSFWLKQRIIFEQKPIFFSLLLQGYITIVCLLSSQKYKKHCHKQLTDLKK